MEMAGSFFCGQIVMSKAGRDKGRLFVIMEIASEEYVLLADGDLRKVENPKKKNIKHLAGHKASLPEIAQKIKNNEKIENIDLRRAIEPYEIAGLTQEN
jgi:ribosomal protein L14E/L6E/L27E